MPGATAFECQVDAIASCLVLQIIGASAMHMSVEHEVVSVNGKGFAGTSMYKKHYLLSRTMMAICQEDSLVFVQMMAFL